MIKNCFFTLEENYKNFISVTNTFTHLRLNKITFFVSNHFHKSLLFAKSYDSEEGLGNLEFYRVEISATVQKDSKEFNGLYSIEMYKKEIVYDKPLYVGTSILDLSKLCMLDFHYNVINKEFENKYNSIYSDTDSLVSNIKTPDLYEWIKNNKNIF